MRCASVGRRRRGAAFSLALASGGCGLFGGAAGAPAGPPPPEEQLAGCPEWTPVDVGQLSVQTPDDAGPAAAAARARQLLESGRLLHAAAVANVAAARCLTEIQTTASTRVLASTLAQVREALSAPKTGDEYVAQARSHTARANAAQARAAWDRALIAYRRELDRWPQRTRLVPTTPAAATADLCLPELRLPATPDVELQVRQLAGTERHLWRLQGPRGSTLFEGPAQQVAAITNDAWLVSHEYNELTLMTRGGRPKSLGAPCGTSWELLDQWLIGTTPHPTLEVFNLAHPERSFTRVGGVSAGVRASRVGPFIEVTDLTDDTRQAVTIFRTDQKRPMDSAWMRERLNGRGEARFFDTAKWGGVLAVRSSESAPSEPMGFTWSFDAIQLDSGKRLAHVELPANAETRPAAAVDERYGLIAVGEGKRVQVAGLGSGAARSVPASEASGQVEDIQITADGLLCTSQVAMARYDSCAMQVTADLNGGSRHRAPHRFCLANSTRAWSGVVPPERGYEHLGSQTRTAMLSVCGQRLAGNGRFAAFLEVKPRGSSAEVYSDAHVSLIDTRTRQRRWRAPLQGSVDPMYPFIDVAFSPDSDYVAVLYERRVQVYRVSDGAQLGRDLPADTWMNIAWSDHETFSGGNAKDQAVVLRSGAFGALVTSTTPDNPGEERCVFGTLLTPAEVCSSVPPLAP